MLCCIVSAERYMFAAVASRFYFSVEQQFSLPGAALFYGCVSLIGYALLKKNSNHIFISIDLCSVILIFGSFPTGLRLCHTFYQKQKTDH